MADQEEKIRQYWVLLAPQRARQWPTPISIHADEMDSTAYETSANFKQITFKKGGETVGVFTNVAAWWIV